MRDDSFGLQLFVDGFEMRRLVKPHSLRLGVEVFGARLEGQLHELVFVGASRGQDNLAFPVKQPGD